MKRALFLSGLLLWGAGCASDDDEAAPAALQPVLVPDRARDVRLDQIELPPGFQIHVYAEDLPGARSLALSPDGALFVGTRNRGSVYAAVDADGDYFAENVRVIDRGLNSPNGVAFRDGSLYVAEISRVLRYDNVEVARADPPEPAVVNDGFP
ncbi:MAG: sorbosone dehydrogenase family protein, partial [Candidatus Latescibacteria bacterium]|nr:sorbosone dehydrogenase family protein [Candidatus Latescibacterota bacterium]